MEITTTHSFSNEIKQYARLIWLWAWLLTLFAVLGGGLSYFFSIQQPKIFQASATVLIDQPNITNDYYSMITNERLAQTYSQMMVQQPTLDGVIEELDLDISVKELQRNLQVEVVPETQLLKITIEDTNPDRAAEIINTIGIIFAEKNAELEVSRYRDTKDSLEAQMLSTDQQIQETTRDLEDVKNVSGVDSQRDILQVQLETYREIYQGLLKQIVELETQPAVDEPEGFAEGESPVDQQLGAIEDKILEISGQIQDLGWPRGVEYDLLNTQLSAYQNLYQQLIKDLVLSGDSQNELANIDLLDTTPDIDTLSTQLEVTGQRIQELTREINESGGSTGGALERDRLETNLVLYRQTYANLVQSYEQVRLAEIQNTTRVDLVQPAIPPTQPARPDVFQNTLLGVVVGLLLGAGVAFLIEILDDTVKGPGDIAHHLKFPVLGYISQMEEDAKFPITAQEPRSSIAESFRSLRTNIQYASIDRPIYSLMITSPTPQDGKSTVAANLGVVLAQGDHQVIVIDADMRRPFQHRIFDLPNRIGLTDTLIHPDVNVNGNFRTTSVENLSILTTGDLPPNPSEVIGSDKMLEMIRQIEAIADIIVIDTPPVMAVTDPVILSTRVDGVIIIVRPGVTKLSAAIHTADQLKQVGANILGIVLNDVENKGIRYYPYYKGYYDRYNKYDSYSSGEKKTRKSRFKKVVEQDS
jgi:capsular exopolysaccharide synthesis family protein